MKITKERAAENREALLAAASKLIRERGIDGVGVADISKEAGLTHGALYAHFSSKEALAAEALDYALQRQEKYLARAREGTLTLPMLIDGYLSPRERDNVAAGCMLAASASDIGRQEVGIGNSFANGYQCLAEIVAEASGKEGVDRQRSLALAAAMIGGLVVARATKKADPALSEEVMAALRALLQEAAAPKPSRRKRTSRE